ncbi:MAG: hypothetical protein ABW022_15500 [Actinoplanes sp.]
MLVRLMAASLLSLGSALAATPVAAQAAPPLCITEHDLLRVGNSIRAYSYRYCDDQPPIPMSVSLQRLNPATGGWPSVAQGMGVAKFTCFGTGVRTYRHAKVHTLTLTEPCT